MSDARRKLRLLALFSWYPLLSTFAMTMVWQWMQFYCLPFMGLYYIRWVDLYAVAHPGYWGGDLVARSQLYYGVYFAALLTVTVLSVLTPILVRRRWLTAGLLNLLWLADTVFLAVVTVRGGFTVQAGIHLAEHLAFLAVHIVLLIRAFRFCRTLPPKERRRRKKKEYDPRFE